MVLTEAGVSIFKGGENELQLRVSYSVVDQRLTLETHSECYDMPNIEINALIESLVSIQKALNL